MEILQKQIDGIEIFIINGKLDVTGSLKAQEIIISAIPKNGKMILNMSHCDYVASSGLRILLIAAKQSAVANCKTVLAGIQEMVWDVIAMTGFEDILESYATEEEAIAALR